MTRLPMFVGLPMDQLERLTLQRRLGSPRDMVARLHALGIQQP